MSVIFSIDEEDSLQDNHQIKVFVNSNKQQYLHKLRRASVSLYPSQVIPNRTIKSIGKAGFSPAKIGIIRSSSETSFRSKGGSTGQTWYLSKKLSPEASRKFVSEKSRLIDRIIQQNNRNLQQTMHKLNLKPILELRVKEKTSQFRMRKKSLSSLKAKVEVERERKLNQKYAKPCPFEPSYLQSEYLT